MVTMYVKIGQRRGVKYLRIEEYIPKRISELCRKRGYSKYRLSQLTGMSQTALGNIMSRDSIPTIPTLEKICDAFGISLAQFFAGDSGKLDLIRQSYWIYGMAWKLRKERSFYLL